MINGRVMNATVIYETTGKYYVSVLVDEVNIKRKKEKTKLTENLGGNNQGNLKLVKTVSIKASHFSSIYDTIVIENSRNKYAKDRRKYGEKKHGIIYSSSLL